MSKVLSTKSKKFQETVATAPLLPGCYIYRNADGKILYIGKAKILRNRVKSYFNNYNRVEEKIRQMIDQAASVEYMIVDSEVEALILESQLIKKYKPKYNSLQVDDKSYAYVRFDKVTKTKEGEYVPLPTIAIVREKPEGKAEYFGPFPDSRIVKRLMKRLRRIFPYCESRNLVQIPASSDDKIVPKHAKPCFYYHIGQCSGACAGVPTRGQYVECINSIKQFFQGQKSEMLRRLETEMTKAAKAQDFEQAAKFRNMIRDIKYVGSNLHIGPDIDEVAVQKEKIAKRARAQSELLEYLQIPEGRTPNPEFRIECYDISNIQGKFAVGSMVVSIGGNVEPSLYRRFRIRMKNEPNDFAMMQEMLTRRLWQLLAEPPKSAKNWKPDESFTQLPGLMIIDGGKGQLSSAHAILEQFGLADKIPLVGLAKREEEIFKLNEQKQTDGHQPSAISYQNTETDSRELKAESEQLFTKIHLPRRSEALYLVQRIRDEAHRFAITYHRKLRAKSLLENS